MPTPKGTKPWNAGTSKGWVDKRGYRWIYVVDGGKRRARREHRVVVEKDLGRSLEPWEVVHHKDGNTANNALENLEIVEWGTHTTEHHKGSRRDAAARRSMEAFALLREQLKHERAVKADLLEAAKEIVRRHGHVSEAMPALIDQDGEEFSAGYLEGIGQAADLVRGLIAEAEGEV